MNDAGAGGGKTAAPVYAGPARLFHWITAAFVLILIPVGIIMVDRGERTNFDALTNTLYSWHKLGGFLVLWLVVARLVYRFAKGAPRDEPTLEPWQRGLAHLTHWSLYALLLIVPLLGWYATALYPALDAALGVKLPAIAAPDQALSERVYELHKIGALLIGALVLAHIGAALFHHVIRKDNVLRRMLPGLPPR